MLPRFLLVLKERRLYSEKNTPLSFPTTQNELLSSTAGLTVWRTVFCHVWRCHGENILLREKPYPHHSGLGSVIIEQRFQIWFIRPAK